jgi:hypothetical protein
VWRLSEGKFKSWDKLDVKSKFPVIRVFSRYYQSFLHTRLESDQRKEVLESQLAQVGSKPWMLAVDMHTVCAAPSSFKALELATGHSTPAQRASLEHWLSGKQPTLSPDDLKKMDVYAVRLRRSVVSILTYR